MHAGLHDDAGLGAGGLPRELQGIATDIADAGEDLGRHVVVGEDHRVAFALEAVDRMDERREQRPLDGGHDVADALVKRRGLTLDFGRERQIAPFGQRGVRAMARDDALISPPGEGVDDSAHGPAIIPKTARRSSRALVSVVVAMFEFCYHG